MKIQPKFTYLNGQLSCRAHEDSLDLALSELFVLSELLGEGQAESKSFSRSSEVSCNDVFSIEDRVETVHLDREKVLVAPIHQILSALLVDVREGRKLSISDFV